MTESTPFPTSPYCQVRARVASIWADGPDDGVHPDWRPAVGEKVVLTPSIGSQLLTYDVGGDDPIIVTVERVDCVVGADGLLTTGQPGRPVYIAPTDDPLLSATGWTWTATIKGKSVRFAAPSGGVADLALFVAAPATNDTKQWVERIPELISLIGSPGAGGSDSPAGVVPIFETLAQAEAWEDMLPGRVALTLEVVEPDTTPPTLGTLTITPEGTKATAVVTGAKDDRGMIEYSFMLGSGAWSEWQTSAIYRFTGLSLSTSYSAKHRVRDRGNNVVEGYSQSFATLAEDLWGTAWKDTFDGDGLLNGRTYDGFTWAIPDPIDKGSWTILPDEPVTSGGVVPNPGVGDGANALRRAVIPYSSAIGSGRTAQGFGASVALPVVPTKIRMDVTVTSSSVSGFVNLWAWGSGPTALTVVGKTMGRFDGGDFTTGMEYPVTDLGPGGGSNAAGTYTLTIEGTRDALNFYRNGVLLSEYVDIPAEAWHNGPRFGFATAQAYADRLIEVTDFSIRWE